MNKTTKVLVMFVLLATAASLAGCQGAATSIRKDVAFLVPELEASWIRDGQPLIFEDEAWIPTDDIEVLTDKEVYLMGEYKKIQFFVEKADVRPYDRLYTKFAENRFRAYTKRPL